MFPTTASIFLKTCHFEIILESHQVAEMAEKLHISLMQFPLKVALHIFVGQRQKQNVDIGAMYGYHHTQSVTCRLN